MAKRFQLNDVTGESFCETTGELFEQVGKLTLTANLIAIEGIRSIEEDKKAAGWSDEEIRGSVDIDKKKESYPRGPITEFSPQSRARLVKQLSMWDPVGALYMVTLTYPKVFPDGKQANKEFTIFKRKIQRDNPDWCACWKVEYQVRGAPHYHLILEAGRNPEPRKTQALKALRQYINEQWQSAREKGRGCGPARTEVELARSKEKAKFYLTKELGKSVQGGKHWQDIIEANIDHYGRIWGWMNKANIRRTGEEYYIPVRIALKVQEKLRKRILDDMIKRKAVIEKNGQFFYAYNDNPLDETMLPSWQLFPDAPRVMEEIVSELEQELGLDFYPFAKERPEDNST